MCRYKNSLVIYLFIFFEITSIYQLYILYQYKAYSTCKTYENFKKLKKIATKKFIFQKGYLKLMSFLISLEKDNKDMKYRYSYIINYDNLEGGREVEVKSLNKLFNEVFNNFKGE